MKRALWITWYIFCSNAFVSQCWTPLGLRNFPSANPDSWPTKARREKLFLKTQMKRSDFSFWSDFAIELTPLLGGTLKYILKKMFLCAGPQWCFHMFFQNKPDFSQFWRLERYTSISTDSNSLGPKCNGICMAKNIRKNIQTWWNQHGEAQPAPVFLAILPVPSPKFHANSVSNQSFPSLPVRPSVPPPEKIFGWLVVPPNLLVSKNNKYFNEGLLLSWNLKHK